MLKLMHKKLSTFSSSKYLFIKTYAAMRLLLVSSADDPCKQFGPRSGPQTFWHSDGIPEIYFFKKLALKKEKKTADDKRAQFLSMQSQMFRVRFSYLWADGRILTGYMRGLWDAVLHVHWCWCGNRINVCWGLSLESKSHELCPF